MDRIAEMQAAIQQQSQDLRDEVAELRRWEEAVKKRDELLRQKSTAKSLVSDVSTLVPESAPPIRGSAPVTSSATASPAAPQRDQTQIYKEQGNDYFRMGQFNDAVRAYTKGIDVDPTSSTMHVLYGNRSMCYLKLKEWALAEKDATTCVQMNRTFTKGFYRRALAR
jgi:tetratricopeptide (TPR) repeat protein